MTVHWIKTQLTFYQLRVGTWRKGVAVVDGMAILHKMQSTALGTVVDLSYGFNDLLVSMSWEYDAIILVFDTLQGCIFEICD